MNRKITDSVRRRLPPRVREVVDQVLPRPVPVYLPGHGRPEPESVVDSLLDLLRRRLGG